MVATRMIVRWVALTVVVALPIMAAAVSPQLAWRQPIYIVAGFAGIIALGFLLVQPALVGGLLPGLSTSLARAVHRWTGSALVVAVMIHVGGLWITSPPDVIDALLFVSPTPFSAWGVVAMWAVLISALLAALRRKWRLRPRAWRVGHVSLAGIIVVGSVVHALLIEGTMEIVTKTVLCVLVLAATSKVLVDLWNWAGRTAPR